MGPDPRVTAVLRWLMPRVCSSDPPGCFASTVLEGEADTDTTVTVASLPTRGRPPQAAARRAGLDGVGEVLTKRQ
jgi:hypothetical protein